MAIASTRAALLGALLTGIAFAGCTGGAPSQGAVDAACVSSDPCGCTPTPPGQTCETAGLACVCSPQTEAGTPDAAPGDTPAFVGEWSPISGTGQSDCNGQITSLPPNPGAILTFTRDASNQLTATSSGAPGCAIHLLVSGKTASLAQSPETCDTATGGFVSFGTFTFVYTAAPDGGAGAPMVDGGAGTDDASTSGDAEADDAGGGDDAAGGDASNEEPDGGSPLPDTLDWELADGDGTCETSLHYTLVRVP